MVRGILGVTWSQLDVSLGSESDDTPDGGAPSTRLPSAELDPLDYFSDDDGKKDIEMANLKRSVSDEEEEVFAGDG